MIDPMLHAVSEGLRGDAYTSCTYCPACWAEIDGDDGEGDAQ